MIEDDEHVIKGMTPLIPIPNVSVGRLMYNHLINCADDEAMIDASTGRSISYKELLDKSCSLAESLRRSGYNETSMVSICSENCIEFFIPVLASLYIGATVAPMNHNYTAPEMIHALEISRPQLIFCSKRLYSKVQTVKRRLNFVKKILMIDGVGPNSINSLISRKVNKFDPVEVDLENHVALILYSSGTTGLSKGVMLTHKNTLGVFAHSDDPRIMLQDQSQYTLGFLPFFHAFGFYAALISFYKKNKIVVISKFEERLFLSSIEKYKVASLALVPPLAVLLATSPLVDLYDLSSVKAIRCGAAPLGKNIEELLKKRLKMNSVRQGYGLTECTLAPVRVPLNGQRYGSSGKVVPNTLCKIRDPETGRSLGPNQVGEICLKGLFVMKGYYRNEEATRNAFTSDGWLLTGDLAYYDEEEYFYIVGRSKELIKYKGFQVPPAELEALLLTHPKVKDAAVVGLPDEEAGELPLAFVVLNQDFTLTEDEVKQFVAEKVSSHKQLRGGVIFVSEIPKTLSGKILRRELLKLLKYSCKSKL